MNDVGKSEAEGVLIKGSRFVDVARTQHNMAQTLVAGHESVTPTADANGASVRSLGPK